MRSSTPGGALGEPLSATNKDLPSGLTLMPRGRFPTRTVVTTLRVSGSMIEISPDASFVTYTRGPVGPDGARLHADPATDSTSARAV